MPRVDNVNFSLRTGTIVPSEVRIVEVPETLIAIHPEWHDDQYFVVRDDLVIVDRDHRIVAVMPVGSSAAQREGGSGITVEAIARGRDGQFVPAGICWVVERSFAWLSRYRRLNTIFERSKEHLIAFVAIAFISILSRRLRRLVAEELSA